VCVSERHIKLHKYHISYTGGDGNIGIDAEINPYCLMLILEIAIICMIHTNRTIFFTHKHSRIVCTEVA